MTAADDVRKTKAKRYRKALIDARNPATGSGMAGLLPTKLSLGKWIRSMWFPLTYPAFRAQRRLPLIASPIHRLRPREVAQNECSITEIDMDQ